ncbi:MAG: 1-phosphofructokinase family hexose kinase [Spirochaetales bacterium]|nr:1-phosphofructokinase family hexose kinase [Spirochaetales bacterium]
MNLNPSFDHWVLLEDRPVLPEVLRGRAVVHQVDGKGLNVARVLSTLGMHEYLCLNVLGGAVGRIIEERIATLSMTARNVWIEEESRVNTAIVHAYDGRRDVQMVNESGPTMTAAEGERLKCAFAETVRRDDMVVISGSTPEGFPPDDMRFIARTAYERGARLAVDIAGDSLRALVEEGPTIVKVNDDELRSAFGIDPERVDTLTAFRREHAIDQLVITFGSKGAIASTGEGVFHAVPPSIETDYAVGSGDSFFAGYLYGLFHRFPVPRALRLAVACGAANARQFGAGLITGPHITEMLDAVRVSESRDEVLHRD